MAVEKASSRVPGRAPGSSRSRFDDSGGLQYVSSKSDLSFRFFLSRVKGQRQKVGHLASPCGGAARGWAAPPYGEPGPWPPLRLIFGLRKASVKIGGSAFISSNSENISCINFLKHKSSRKQGTGTVASC
jgi:hypothetical protein